MPLSIDLDKILPPSPRHIHTLSLQPHIRPPYPYYHRQPALLTGYSKDSDLCKLGEEIGAGHYDIFVILILARYIFCYPYESSGFSLHLNRTSSPVHVSLSYHYKSFFILFQIHPHDEPLAPCPLSDAFSNLGYNKGESWSVRKMRFGGYRRG